MPMSTASFIFTSEVYLKPLFPEKSRPRGVNLAPNTVFPTGAVLIPVSSAQNDVQTITAPGSSTYTLTGTNPATGVTFTTAALAFGASDATVQAALVLGYGAGNVTVASLVATFAGQLANMPVPMMTIATTGSGSPGVVHTTIGASAETLTLYAAAGTGTPTCLNVYGCVTDSSGNVTFGAQTGGEYLTGGLYPYGMAFFGGSFATQDLSGLDSNAVTKLGRLSSGTTTSGILEVIGF